MPAPLTGWRIGDAGFTIFGPKVEGAISPRTLLTGKDRAVVRLAAAAPDLLAACEAALVGLGSAGRGARCWEVALLKAAILKATEGK